MKNLASRTCVPCHGGVPRITGAGVAEYLKELNGWEAIEEHHLQKRFAFPNFRDALRFVDTVGTIAEAEGHHPDIGFGWGYAEIKIYTHAIDGLSEADFILAAKIDAHLL